jgi:hypothetical protein
MIYSTIKNIIIMIYQNIQIIISFPVLESPVM